MRVGKLGGHTLDVVKSENYTKKSNVTSHPVEQGSDIVDHIENEGVDLDITVVFSGKDAWQRLKAIRDIQNNKQLVNYVGRNIVHNIVILDMSSDHSAEVSDGAEVDIKLKEIKFATSKRFGESVVGEKLQTQTARRVNQGRQQVITK